MWNPGDDKKTAGMMISAVVIVCLALIAVIFAFVMLQRRHESEISAASDTEGQTEITIEIGKAKKEEETAGEDGDEAEEDAEDSTGESESVYLVKGKDTGSNPYEKADHLAYTDSVRYTWEELSWLDSYGLCITRNEIYARHGRMFNDQDIQDYFNRQDWYVAQTSSADFDESVLNDVELYNVELIHSYELKQGY
ncbi:MAG TPA: YARHG domain-containing protein [Candidatus Anaerobutyricum stercoris]|uniref:YARHG domain-containing protein n=1 Tax=Candidatus Anaerobutyricum stercoris TaxID=2838457 RepID=A0A9D2J7K7_9FIRM|nr:YARHG domain-containing protein [Eubacterium sp. An3]OUO29083.1 hypothetical protein B5F87_04790 [Eubacterium sp. An3]HIZ39067.1 YARHG domain-containing protein [Candidatus Anaerobutyricum stercoris]